MTEQGKRRNGGTTVFRVRLDDEPHNRKRSSSQAAPRADGHVRSTPSERKRSQDATSSIARKPAHRQKADSDYIVGHGRPPREYTWQPGYCPNPKGRPKGRKNEATIWKEILGRKVSLPIGGRPKKVTIQEAIQYRIANDALGGNIKSAGFILNRFATIVTGEGAPAADLSEDDRAVLEAFARRLTDEAEEET